MLPMQQVRKQLGNLLAADVSTLAPVAANQIALVVSPFVPTENITLGTLTLASFTGGAPKSGVAGAQGVGQDPATKQQRITILPPIGGWRWVCTVAPSPPQTVYGAALIDSTGTTLLGLQQLLVSQNINSVGDEIDLGNVEMDFVSQPLS